MYDYIKPAQRDFKPEIFVLHVETNDLTLEDIVTLAELMKTETNEIIVPSIVCRSDSFGEKVCKVCKLLSRGHMCRNRLSSNYSQ